jgi:hypothetical protein
MTIKLIWEQIDDYHQRAKVFGGWLVKSYDDIYEDRGYGQGYERGYQWRTAMCFVPDPRHVWGMFNEK